MICISVITAMYHEFAEVCPISAVMVCAAALLRIAPCAVTVMLGLACVHVPLSIETVLAHAVAQPAGAPNVTSHNLTYPFTFTSFAVSLLLVFR